MAEAAIGCEEVPSLLWAVLTPDGEKKKIDVNDKTTPQCQRLGSRETTCVLLVWSGLRLTTWLAHAVGGSDHVVGRPREEGSPKPAGRPIAQLTDDLLPLLAKHTLDREKQGKEKWRDLSNVKLPGEVLEQQAALKLAFFIYLAL